MYHDFDDSKDKNVGVSVHAGFPNAAEDRTGKSLDFNALLVQHPSSTYCFRIEGTAYEEQGIFNGDIAVIDRALTPRTEDLAVCFEEDNFIIVQCRNLKPRTEIWGVITATIHRTRT